MLAITNTFLPLVEDPPLAWTGEGFGRETCRRAHVESLSRTVSTGRFAPDPLTRLRVPSRVEGLKASPERRLKKAAVEAPQQARALRLREGSKGRMVHEIDTNS